MGVLCNTLVTKEQVRKAKYRGQSTKDSVLAMLLPKGPSACRKE